MISAEIISSLPFFISVLIEIISPRISGRFEQILSNKMNDLEDDQIGEVAETEVKEFAEYAFDILQMYTALAVTVSAGLLQVSISQGWSPGRVLVVVVLSIAILGFVWTKDFRGDTAVYQTWKNRWRISPFALTTLSINLIILFVIFFF